MARARVPAPATFMALLVVAMAVTAAGAGSDVAAPAPAPRSSTICDTANCGKGTCSEAPGPVVTDLYKCTCDPGWSQPKFMNLSVAPVASWLPCIIPDCSFSGTCINTTVWAPGIPVRDPCVIVDCGQGGDCENGPGFSYQCRCQPGFRNLLDDTSMPCIDGSCTFGPDCAKLGLVNTPAAPAPAPIGN